jgi:hypothetical protein
MGGVDRADQLRAYHTCARKSQTWWKQLFYFLIDVSRVNAWICYKASLKQHSDDSDHSSADSVDLNPSKNTTKTHSDFVMDIAEQLIDGYMRGEVRDQGSRRQNTKAKPVPAHNAPQHCLVRMPGKSGRTCLQCKQEGIQRLGGKGRLRTTTYGCRGCNTYLHQGMCYTKFHAAAGVPGF